MKPVSLRFQCFGPYMDEQFIDFSRLAESGLFLICGETGAGKTTILDAMCCALYGRSSGGLRGGLEAMRCKSAGREDETLLEFVFDVGTRRYCFSRSLKYARKNLNDFHNCLLWQGGDYVPLLENPTMTRVNEQAEQIIGLTYDQFRQVIILPQGQFERLLVSKSDEKETILVSLFHAERWQRATDRLYRQAADRDNALKQEWARLQDKLAQYGCHDLDGLAAVRSEHEKTARDALAALEAAQAEAGARREAYTAAALIDRDFQELRRRRQALDGLLAQIQDRERKAALLDRAGQAAQIEPIYEAYRERQLQARKAAQAEKDWEREAQAAQGRLDKVKGSQSAYDSLRGAQDERLRDIALRQNARPLYQSLDLRQRETDAAAQALGEAERRFQAAEGAFQEADRRWRRAMEEQDAVTQRYQDAQRAYLQGIGGVLARELRPGLPCPVCGSRDHPSPAPADEVKVTAEDLKALNEAVLAAGEAVRQAGEVRSQAETAQKSAQTLREQRAQTAAAAAAAFHEVVKGKLPGINTQKELEAEIAALQQAADAYRAAGERLSAELLAAEGGVKAAGAALEGAVRARKEAEEAWNEKAAQWTQALARSGLDGEEQFRSARMDRGELEDRKNALAAFRANLDAAQAAWREQSGRLEGQAAPLLAELEAALREAEEAEKAGLQASALAREALNRVGRDYDALARALADHDAARRAVDQDLAFANALSGRKGISLQRYVLGVMLTAITAEANRLLRSVHGGRYQLYRSDESTGRTQKRGLELDVLDHQSGERRSVTTLSGGEKFLVSLSLAIGLSTVVQAQGGGIRLEAMFIDEGFGSLDGSSISDAFEVLQGIQRSHGLVGIISHVERLEETITSRIEVVKGPRGSTLRTTF